MGSGKNEREKVKLKKEHITKDKSSRLHGLEVPIIGLTGGIATGKSTAASLLEKHGILVINADHLVKSIYATTEMLSFVEANFPEVIEDKQIDFKKLRQLAFSNLEVRTNLEKEIYAKLPEAFMKVYSEKGSPDLVVYDVPLLFEKGLDQKVDLKVCVYSDKTTQLLRLTKRDNVSQEQAELALANQMDIEEKKKRSDAIIENTDTIERLQQNVEEFVNNYLDN
ncbi:MAG: dephospho-CoA kinase [Deltaproteobacteria bacterium]|nr:MAG: dephospho-CoA kinase [Deltaproteobacteria bacterium]